MLQEFNKLSTQSVRFRTSHSRVLHGTDVCFLSKVIPTSPSSVVLLDVAACRHFRPERISQLWNPEASHLGNESRDSRGVWVGHSASP